MASKLDQPLDSLLAARKRTRPVRRAGRGTTGAKPATTPVGGVKKATKPAKKDQKPAVPTAPAKGRPESKILVSNLPSDVTETQIKEYFQEAVGPVRRIILNYGPNGQSRGIANIIFGKAESASKAVQELNGVKVDGKPMRVELVLDGKDAPAPQQPKKLADRVSTPKNAANAKPKPATQNKADKAGAGNKPGDKKKGKPRPKRQGRVKKTAEELDLEMKDYFQANSGEAGAAQPAAAAPATTDTAMGDDEI